MQQSEVRVRFAPSPTGHLHVGGARQAIFNWLFAKSLGGKFLLRIEDTDMERSKQEYTDSIVAALKWLGLTIDEEVMIQSHNIKYHNQVAAQLIQKDQAYKCFCSIDELKELRESSEDIAFKYPGTCRNLSPAEQPDGKPFVIRFKLPKMPRYLDLEDQIKGSVSIEASVLDDFVIVKSDTVPTYNFAVVLDDLTMRITHVLRGEDHIINTFRQILLYQALSQPLPKFAHASMILGPNGERLSKRHGATAVIDYQKMGILSEAMFNYLVRLGWSHGDQEIFSRDELVKLFTIDAIGTKNSIFDVNKLMWLNTVYIKSLALDDFLARLEEIDPVTTGLISSGTDKPKLTALFELYKPRATTLLELSLQLKTCLQASQSLAKESFESISPEGIALLQQFLPQALALKNFCAAELQDLAKKVTLEAGKKVPDLAKPLRFLLSGYLEGASTFALCEIFGPSQLEKILALLD